MKKVWSYLIDYQRKHFDWKMYGVMLIFLTCCIIINYRLDFEDSIIDSYHGEPIKWLWMFLFHAFPFVTVTFILVAFGKVKGALSNGNYWLKVLVGFGLLALDRSFYGYNYLLQDLPRMEFYFVVRCFNWASSLILVVVPLLLLYPFLEQDRERIWYGLKWKRFDPSPYLFLLLIAAVFIGIGSFLSEINEYYPRYSHTGVNLYLRANPDTPEWWTVLVYELCYGSNFISVELIFRGFLIFAFTRTLGSYAVLPMVATYAFLHFGKPLGETISSVFGGYVLGIISFNSRNIWGGIFIHLGVAWLMELFGWLQQ
ncbi:MAG: hypothetical protein Tsb0034_17990 [Ekhidna sp.]